jgi:hypothetical protein
VTPDSPDGEVVRAHPDGTALSVRAVPGAASSCLAGLAGGVLRVRVAAARSGREGERGAAVLLAGRLGLRPRALRLAAGRVVARSWW